MTLRLLDLGEVSGLRSQTSWHALAEAMRPGDAPVLAFQRPTEAYVSIGYHRALGEIDEAACAQRGLPVYRRRAGGGPVYCDEAQLFFQLIMSASAAPRSNERAWRRFLEPSVEAFRRMGAEARATSANDILVGDRKVSGLGAATIGEAMVFVGNVIFDFDYDAMTAVLALPSDVFSGEVARLMRRYLATIDAVAGARCLVTAAKEHLTASFDDAFGGVSPSELNAAETEAATRLDELFVSRDWVAARRPLRRPAVKIRAGVGVVDLDGTMVSFADGRIERVAFGDRWIAAPGMRAELERALVGLPLDEAILGNAADGAPRGREFASAIVHAHRTRF